MLATAGCKEVMEALPLVGDDEIKAGEPVLFTAYAPRRAMTREMTETDFNNRMDSFNIVADDYKFTVEMFRQGVIEDGKAKVIGTAAYEPDTTMTITNAGTGSESSEIHYATDGSLKATATTAPLYWPDNTQAYGFRATAGTTTLQADQTDKAKQLLQDRLVGFGFEPLWDATNQKGTDDEDTLNYRTTKQWYQTNKDTRGLAPGGVDAASWYKKIPLYLKHRRSKITIRLKAGEGVDRRNLHYDNAVKHVHTTIYSWGSATKPQAIHPLAKQTTIDYEKTAYGEAEAGAETMEYTAIVEPHNYLKGTLTDTIARINLSSQHFTFYASNDNLYNDSKETAATNHDAAVTHMEHYDLKPGQHLVITVTLSRDSRKILITAYVHDWEETITTSIVDDYGQAGDPIQINSRQQLYEFLSGPKNKPGNVAIIVPNSLNLEKNGTADLAWDYATQKPDSVQLWCTLNLAGATLRTDHPIFSKINPLGNVVNGTISVGTNKDVETIVTSAIAQTNLGTIQHINVVPKDANGNDSKGKASVAGLVQTNSGSIIDCTSTLPVYGTYSEGAKNLVGGITASSVYSAENGSVMPVIDGCTVNARVDGQVTNSESSQGVRGAGIVGEAVGRVTNNTFEYGRTLLQNATLFKNTIHHKAAGTETLRAFGNAWPTTANANGDGIPSTNTNITPEAERYTAVIDSQEELAELLVQANNYSTARYRLSDDFSLTNWTHGHNVDVGNESGGDNILFELDGNNKTITTDGMVFSNISNSVHDLTIQLSKDLIATKEKTKEGVTTTTGGDAIAALAYSVREKAKISNIQVKTGNFRIQAENPGGVVVWAYGDATIENCQFKGNIQVWVSDLGTQAKTYCGGIVANAAKATITRCVFHSTGGTLYHNNATTYNATPVEATGAANMGIFFGGILGGTVPKGTGSQEYPSVLITDCTSWFSTTGNAQKGAIVGYAEYSNISNETVNGLASGCQGNWWPVGSDAIGTHLGTMTIEQLIGKKNAVAPTPDTSY